jgi:hypothetical protein
MYKISKLTGKIYDSNNNEIILKDGNPDYELMLQWQQNEGTFIEFDGTIEELEQLNQKKIQELKKLQYEELLPTDWYFVRLIEKNITIPEEILNEREQIRIKYNNLINEINNE